MAVDDMRNHVAALRNSLQEKREVAAQRLRDFKESSPIANALEEAPNASALRALLTKLRLELRDDPNAAPNSGLPASLQPSNEIC